MISPALAQTVRRGTPPRSLDAAHPLAEGLAVALLLDRFDPPNLGALGGAFREPAGSVVAGGLKLSGAGPSEDGGSTPFPTPSGAFSLFARLRLDADPTSAQANIMSLYGDEGGGAQFQVRFGDSGDASERRRLVSPSGGMATNSIPLGAWCSVGLTIGPGLATRFYLDGLPNGSAGASSMGGSEPRRMRVGVVTAYGRPFLGPISHLYVWHGRELTAAQMLSLHNAPSGPILNP